jgi:hypothetical protein
MSIRIATFVLIYRQAHEYKFITIIEHVTCEEVGNMVKLGGILYC